MQVRRARLEDAAAIAEVHARTWREAYEHVFGAARLAALTPASRLPLWRQALAGDRDTFIGVQEGRVVAFVSVGPSRDEDAEGELGEIYVLPEMWGTGAGSSLLEAGVEAMRARGYGDAVLWVLDDNPRARRFYEREGWALEGAVKEDDFLGVTVREVRYRRQL